MQIVSALAGFHIAADAEMQAFGDHNIVSTYGQLPIEYAAIYRAAGFMDMSHRGVVVVGGEERLAFLNNVLTAELVNRETKAALPSGEMRFAYLLDRKGRIQAEMNVLETGHRCILEMDARLVENVVNELERYHFREKVTITWAGDEVSEIGIFGPAAARIVEAIGGPKAGEFADLKCAAMPFGDSEGVVFGERMGEVLARYLLVPGAVAERVWSDLVRRFAQEAEPGRDRAIPIGWAALNAARIEAGRPLLGIDYDSTFLPAETGQLDRAVSFTKGCYPGQEIVARMQSRHQIARMIVGLRLSGSELPLAGEKVFDDAGNEVGAITSSTISPRLSNRALALAIIRKEANVIGTKVQVPAEGALRPAEVVPTPFA